MVPTTPASSPARRCQEAPPDFASPAAAEVAARLHADHQCPTFTAAFAYTSADLEE